MMRAGYTVRTILLIGAVAAVLSACGRRPGTLDTPYEAGIEARKQAEKDGQPLPPEPEKPVEDRRFILDSLI
jgi:predicted small lipoprotein YifL